MTARPKVSVFMPVYNEEETLPLLQEKIDEALEPQAWDYEVIYVNDGSSDRSWEVLTELATTRPQMKIVNFRRNYGQTPAMQAGIDAARGDILVPMDSDLQNDPSDIPMLIEKIESGFDVVSGWRKYRKDTFVDRTLPSMIANKLISKLSGVHLHDYGCSLKAYKREVLKEVNLYGELHRFIPVCASWVGAKVTEVPVKHHERQFGESKYGINRTFKVILDLAVMKFLTDYANKPIYVFGGISMVSMLASFATLVWMLALKFISGTDLDATPLPILSAMFFTVSIQVLMMGILADLVMRTYYESQNKKIYHVLESQNLSAEADRDLALAAM